MTCQESPTAWSFTKKGRGFANSSGFCIFEQSCEHVFPGSDVELRHVEYMSEKLIWLMLVDCGSRQNLTYPYDMTVAWQA